MKNTTTQGLVIVGFFFSMLFILNQVNWMQIFKVQQTTAQTNKKLGELFWDFYKKSETLNENKTVITAVDSIVNNICKANKIERKNIKVHVVNKNEVNAFALPNGHLVVNTALIDSCKTSEELAGVIAHEIAHIEYNHVMNKLVKEIGLTILISMTTGSTGSETIKGAIKLLTSSAFDRKLEKEADIKAVDYLVNAGINPIGFSNFLSRLDEQGNTSAKYLSWVSTHPESKTRAKYIIKYSKTKKETNFNSPDLSAWENVQKSLKN
jgi:predicted Zn-dependent protease